MSDLISRQAAIDAVNKNRDSVFHDSVHYEDAVYDISNLPSADRPQGEWVDAEIPLESGDTMPIQVCNLCKTFYPLAYTGGGHRFCPNCGARMKGEEDE